MHIQACTLFHYFSLNVPMKYHLIQEGAMQCVNFRQSYSAFSWNEISYPGTLWLYPVCSQALFPIFQCSRKDWVACGRSQCLSYLTNLFQCSNYSRGLITGSLCRPLCETKEIEFEKCLGHGVKLHVLKARWKDSGVILKTPKQLGSSIAVRHAISSLLPGSQQEKEKFTMNRKTFIERVCTTVYDPLSVCVELPP